MAKLNPGAMGSAGELSEPTEFASSMAELIDQTLHDVLTTENSKEPFDMADNSAQTRARRALIVAIAQGVCNYLSANADAFVINGSDESLSLTIEVAS